MTRKSPSLKKEESQNLQFQLDSILTFGLYILLGVSFTNFLFSKRKTNKNK